MSILCIRARFGTPIAHYRATLEVIWTHLYGCDLTNVMFFFLLSILPWLPVWIEGLLWWRVTSLVAEAQKRVYGAVALDLTSKLPILSHNATSTTPIWWKGMHEILYILSMRGKIIGRAYYLNIKGLFKQMYSSSIVYSEIFYVPLLLSRFRFRAVSI